MCHEKDVEEPCDTFSKEEKENKNMNMNLMVRTSKFT